MESPNLEKVALELETSGTETMKYVIELLEKIETNTRKI